MKVDTTPKAKKESNVEVEIKRSKAPKANADLKKEEKEEKE